MSLRSALNILYRKPLLQSKHNNLRRLIQRNTTMATSVKETKKERDSFQDLLPSIMGSLEKHKNFSEVPSVGAWIRKMLEYNLTGGKLNRGLTTVFAYEMLEKPENITEESLKSARILGWCVEILQAYLLVLDDIMDGSSTRRGVPCWYRLPGVGLSAINDAVLINCVLQQILKENFGTNPYYIQIVDVFQESLLNTSMGQHLDIEMVYRSQKDYSAFTKERLDAIVKFKTSYYTYKLPVALGMYLANKTSETHHKLAEEICLDIGRLFQMQDDYIDCYGDESVTGKAGTDIQEGKCSWLAVTAFNQCSPKQKIVFKSCYGSKEPAHIERIKFIYEQLNIQNTYLEEERRLYDQILSKIKALPEDLSPALFIKLVDMIYKRKL